jgi:fatty acid synthase subunit alpha
LHDGISKPSFSTTKYR